MSARLQIIIIACMAISLIYISLRINSKKIDYKFGMIWALVSVVIMIFAIWPRLLAKISKLIGIYDPVNMLTFVGLVLVIMIIFSMSMEISKQSEQIKRLAQELAILRKDEHDKRENLGDENICDNSSI